MPAWRPLYKEATTPEGALALALATRPDTAPGLRYLYSDLNAILLGRIVAAVGGQPLDAFLAARVFGPLGMADTRFNPPPSERPRIAPTEYDSWRQRSCAARCTTRTPSRSGGVSGHAGLFSTAADLSRFAARLLGGGRSTGGACSTRTRRAVRRGAGHAISRRAIGLGDAHGGNSAGHYLSRARIGHTGFTGTSLWVDRERGVFVLLLTKPREPDAHERARSAACASPSPTRHARARLRPRLPTLLRAPAPTPR
jgi:CubicO group peptidase (beta-lactamase class C family)